MKFRLMFLILVGLTTNFAWAGEEAPIQTNAAYFSSSSGDGSNYLQSLNMNQGFMAGRFIRATTKCYFMPLDPYADCPDYVIASASMKTGTPPATVCNAAKRAAVSPPGCQRKHCTPCTYASP